MDKQFSKMERNLFLKGYSLKKKKKKKSKISKQFKMRE